MVNISKACFLKHVHQITNSGSLYLLARDVICKISKMLFVIFHLHHITNVVSSHLLAW